jgi:glycosyltransferase involved in cell wall biosynthesis
MPDKLTIVTTCKGRLSQLKNSLDSWLQQKTEIPYGILVVDYGCPDGTFGYVSHLGEPRVGAVKVVSDVDVFRLSHARNIGANRSCSTVIGFVDADVSLHEDWAEAVTKPILEGKVVATRPKWDRAGCGVCSVSRAVFEEIRGFSEDLTGWGWEDKDFFLRLGSRPVGHYPRSYLRIEDHSNEDRLRFYEDKRLRGGKIPESNFNNEWRAKHRNSLPNLAGYGQASDALMYNIRRT